MAAEGRQPSSFRDNAGFLFTHNGILLRQVNRAYQKEYQKLQDSGLHAKLVEKGLLVNAVETKESGLTDDAIAVLKPEIVPFISYPYEWPFHALKDAALATLEIQKIAIEHGMSLRDASAFNIQFVNGKPLFIDTLSFGIYEEGKPWSAYRQFCQHFLAPLVLMAQVDPSLGRLSQLHIDGVPLGLAAKLAPGSSKWNVGLGIHLHTHAKTQAKSLAGEKMSSSKPVSKLAMQAWIDSLETTIGKIDWKPEKTTWSDYYGETNYREQAMAHKRKLVADFLETTGDTKTCWDLGANTGEFSTLAASRGMHTVSWDFDHACVDANYLQVKKNPAQILPLILDLTNPTPAIGWAHQERMSLEDRGPADVLLALAITHHLALGNNMPCDKISDFFARIGKHAIVEFVPKEDSQSQRLIQHREEVFESYSLDTFERGFATHFETVCKQPIEGSMRTLFLFKRKS